MTAYVLVHSPLVGPSTWAGVAGVLAGDGHRVVIPSLAAVTAAGPPFARPAAEKVAAAVAAADVDGPVAVVAHSGAGPLLPAIGAALAGRAACHLFVDAALPDPGRTRLADLHPSLRSHLADLVGDDLHLPPWHEWWGPGTIELLVPDPGLRAALVAEGNRLPHAMFEEPLPVTAGWPDAPCGYLRLSEGYVAEEARASGLGWPVSTLAGTHLEPVNDPERVAAAIEALRLRTVAT